MVRLVCLLLVFSAAVFAVVMGSRLNFEQRYHKETEDSVISNDVMDRIDSQEKTLHAQKEEIERLKNDVKLVGTRLSEAISKLDSYRRVGSGIDIAFSSYLSHSLSGLRANQVIVFDSVTLNEGDGYDKSTGIFTVPMDGTYIFFYFIGLQNKNQLYVKLTVDEVEKSNAVVETVQKYDDGQGGNVVILSVSKGQKVAIQHKEGGYIESWSTNRFSTFSGFMLHYG